jgi:hypothetical protein
VSASLEEIRDMLVEARRDEDWDKAAEALAELDPGRHTRLLGSEAGATKRPPPFGQVERTRAGAAGRYEVNRTAGEALSAPWFTGRRSLPWESAAGAGSKSAARLRRLALTEAGRASNDTEGEPPCPST